MEALKRGKPGKIVKKQEAAASCTASCLDIKTHALTMTMSIIHEEPLHPSELLFI